MKKIHMLLIVSLFTCNILGAAAIDYNAFHRAITGNVIDEVRGFLERGADVHYDNGINLTPLHKASYFGYVKLAEMFLERGADVNAVRVDCKSTPLMRPAEVGHMELVELLLKWYAHVNAEDIYGDTPLHYAARGGHEGVVRALLESGADKGVKNRSDRTAAQTAHIWDHHDIAKLITLWNDDIKEPGDD